MTGTQQEDIVQVHEFVDGRKPIMVLIHGVLTPWQIWMPQIEAFRKEYNIYAVALSAHTEDSPSEFVSVQDEAAKITAWLKERTESVDVLCGLSLGGKIAHEIWKSGQLSVQCLVMDGAPLVSCPRFAVSMMAGNYKQIVHRSKARDAKTIANFKRYFLPEQYLQSYLKIADLMTDRSIENIVNSVFAGGRIEGPDHQSRILFIHGTKANEILSAAAARRMKKCHPETEIVCFKGDAHCHKAIYEPTKWISAVRSFLSAR